MLLLGGILGWQNHQTFCCTTHMVPQLLNVGGKRHRSFRVEKIFLVHASLNQQKQGHQEPSMIGPSHFVSVTNSGVKKVGGGGSTAGPGTGGVVESDGQAMWDEDDVMLFLWGNSQAAKERHVEEVAEKSEQIEQWRGGVPQELV